MVIIGVDEAGRGPVLGSLFVGAVAAPDRDHLPTDVADSKTLSDTKRTTLADELLDDPAIQTTVVELTVDEIDHSDRSLTELVARAFADGIDQLAVPGASASVDTGEADTDRFVSRIDRYLSTSIEVQAAVGADVTDPVVSAASIIAKATREEHVASLSSEYGTIGSGYPSDPTTRQFLAEFVGEHGTLPDCARASWSTSQDVLTAAEQAGLQEFTTNTER